METRFQGWDWRGSAPCGLRRPARLGLCGLIAACVLGCGRGVTKGEVDFADGLERLALGDSAGALQLLERSNYELGGDPRLLFHIGRILAMRPSLEERTRAREALFGAVYRSPESGLYRAGLGELLRNQRYLRASTDMLAEAVELDPGLGSAWRLLGQNLQDEYFLDIEVPALLDSAIACYERALACEPLDEEARYRLAFLRLHRRELESARALLLSHVRADCPGRFGLLLAAIEYHDSQYAESQRLVDAALGCMSRKEREEWTGLNVLLHPDSVSAYRIVAPAGRDSISLRYWWDRDPTPTTLTNEALVEHVSRNVEADVYFGIPWLAKAGRNTDRGEVFLRYGPPQAMVRVTDSVEPRWDWFYDDVGKEARVFRFYDFALSGDYVLDRRHDLSRLSAFESQPTQTNVVVRNRAGPGDWRHIVRQFRGTAGRTAVEIVYDLAARSSIAALSLEVAAWRGPGDLAEERRATLSCDEMAATPGWRRVGRMRVELPPRKLVLGLQALALGPSVPEPSGGGTPTPSSADTLEAKGIWVSLERDTLEVEAFDPDALGLSDLLLAHELRDGSGGPFDMGGMIVVPRVDSSLESEKLHLYFEIYPSRRVLREKSALAVRYEVRPLPPRTWSFLDQFRPSVRRRLEAGKRPVVQSTFPLRPASDIERQQLSIDIGALEAGPYELEVEIADPATGETFRRIVEFDFVREPKRGT